MYIYLVENVAKLKLRRKSRKRVEASRKAWDTRIRKEGIRQTAKALATLASNEISKATAIADAIIGTVKALAPREYRELKKKSQKEKKTLTNNHSNYEK